MQSQHVPAWKRLGLKLKFAKDIENHAEIRTPPQKRAADDFEPADGTVPASTRASKRSRTKTSPQPTVRPNGNETTTLVPSLRLSHASVSKKKVSFTAETKQTDGDSSRFLLAAWDNDNFSDSQEFEHYQSYHDHQARSQDYASSPKSSDVDHSASRPLPERNGRGKQSRGDERETSKPQKSKHALDYLEQHHDDRPRWKFNKNREVWILKHIWSTTDVPINYDMALSDYIAGLQSKSARTRLIDQCIEAFSEHHRSYLNATGTDPLQDASEDSASTADQLSMADASRRKAYYRAMKGRLTKRHDPSATDSATLTERTEHDNQLAVLGRADMLLDTMQYLSETPNGVNHAVDKDVLSGRSLKRRSDSSTEPKVPSRGKKRKLRTSVLHPSDTSSSSDAEDSSSSEPETASQSPEAVIQPRLSKPAEEETTSSSVSDTSSEGESESSSRSGDDDE